MKPKLKPPLLTYAEWSALWDAAMWIEAGPTELDESWSDAERKAFARAIDKMRAALRAST